MDYIKGALVKNAAGEQGIVTDDRRDKLIILMGDGLHVEDDRDNWETIPFGDHAFNACFVELLPYFEMAPDVRVKLAQLELRYEELQGKYQNLYSRLNNLEGVKAEVTEALTK